MKDTGYVIFTDCEASGLWYYGWSATIEEAMARTRRENDGFEHKKYLKYFCNVEDAEALGIQDMWN